MGTCAIKGTGENKGFRQMKTLFSKNYCQKIIAKKLFAKKYPIKFYAPGKGSSIADICSLLSAALIENRCRLTVIRRHYLLFRREGG
jgi:hypothetical protein